MEQRDIDFNQVNFIKRRLQNDSKSTKSTIDFDAGETLEGIFPLDFPC